MAPARTPAPPRRPVRRRCAGCATRRLLMAGRDSVTRAAASTAPPMAARQSGPGAPEALETMAMPMAASASAAAVALSRRMPCQGWLALAACVVSVGSPSASAISAVCHTTSAALRPSLAVAASCSGHQMPAPARPSDKAAQAARRRRRVIERAGVNGGTQPQQHRAGCEAAECVKQALQVGSRFEFGSEQPCRERRLGRIGMARAGFCASPPGLAGRSA